MKSVHSEATLSQFHWNISTMTFLSDDGARASTAALREPAEPIRTRVVDDRWPSAIGESAAARETKRARLDQDGIVVARVAGQVVNEWTGGGGYRVGKRSGASAHARRRLFWGQAVTP